MIETLLPIITAIGLALFAKDTVLKPNLAKEEAQVQYALTDLKTDEKRIAENTPNAINAAENETHELDHSLKLDEELLQEINEEDEALNYSLKILKKEKELDTTLSEIPESAQLQRIVERENNTLNQIITECNRAEAISKRMEHFAKDNAHTMHHDEHKLRKKDMPATGDGAETTEEHHAIHKVQQDTRKAEEDLLQIKNKEKRLINCEETAIGIAKHLLKINGEITADLRINNPSRRKHLQDEGKVRKLFNYKRSKAREMTEASKEAIKLNGEIITELNDEVAQVENALKVKK